MELKEIQDLIKLINKSNIGEIRIEKKDFKISLKTKDHPVAGVPATPVSQVVQQPATPPPAPATPEASGKEEAPAKEQEAAPGKDAAEGNYVEIKSPMIGTFYRSSGPDKDPFVKVGDAISPGDVVCIIEAMKLFNEIESEVSGKIVKVLVDNASPVQYDQPLFLVDPS